MTTMEVTLPKDYIFSLIEKKGMSKSEFASQMGVARQNLDAMLESKKKDINMVIKMSEIFEMPLLEFLRIPTEKPSIYGVLYVNGAPVIVNNKQDIEDIMKKVSE